MEITIKIDGRMVSVDVSTEVGEFLEEDKRKARNLQQEQQRHWDMRSYDEYIIATEGRLPYCATPEDVICQRETQDEIMAVLALCTEKQRERFLLHALYDLSYEEVGKLCGCSRQAVHLSVEAVRKIFLRFFKNHLGKDGQILWKYLAELVFQPADIHGGFFFHGVVLPKESLDCGNLIIGDDRGF